MMAAWVGGQAKMPLQERASQKIVENFIIP